MKDNRDTTLPWDDGTPPQEVCEESLEDDVEALPPLCEEQQRAMERIMSSDKRVTIVTGYAGVGKSVLMKTLVHTYPELFTVTSTTARSALHIGGVTVDRLFSINRSTWKFRDFNRMEDNLRSIGPYIIGDEFSMVGAKMADLIEESINHTKKKLIMCGDWAQASPVKDNWPVGHPLMKGADIIFLRECHRQQDGEFLTALNLIREGTVTPWVREYFRSRIFSGTRTDEESDQVVKMYATNAKVDRYNHDRLERHVEKDKMTKYTLTSTVTDLRDKALKDKYPLRFDDAEKMLDQSPLAHNEPIAKNCRVIVTFNVPESNRFLRAEHPYIAVNGDTGTLLEEGDPSKAHTLAVRLDRTGKEVYIPRVTLESKGIRRGATHSEYELRGYPLRLGYAVTIHKSQGMTLDRVDIDMASIMAHPKESRHGLAYVAFSRARTPEGLCLLNWCEGSVYSDPTMAKLIRASGMENENAV